MKPHPLEMDGVHLDILTRALVREMGHWALETSADVASRLATSQDMQTALAVRLAKAGKDALLEGVQP